MMTTRYADASAHGAGLQPGAILLEEQYSPDDFNQATGVRHAAFMTFFSFPQVLDAEGDEHGKVIRFMAACRSAGAKPALTLEAFGGLRSFTRDDVLRLADLLASFQTPIILRWNHEMNGSWYPWGQQPALYIERFRECSSIMRHQAPAVEMAWTPNQGWGYPWPGCKHFSPPPADNADPYAPYYPGDDSVDWVGLSFYHWGETRGANQAPPPDKWISCLGVGNAVPNFHDLYAAGRRKPMMIAETSALYDLNNVRGGGASETDIKAAWIRQVYGSASQLPWLKTIFWFNILKHEDEVGGPVDWRVSANPSVTRVYREEVEKACSAGC